MRPFDGDHLVDELLTKRIYYDTEKYELATEREWHVLKLEKVSPDHVTWFDPPDGAGMRTVETNSYRIRRQVGR